MLYECSKHIGLQSTVIAKKLIK